MHEFQGGGESLVEQTVISLQKDCRFLSNVHCNYKVVFFFRMHFNVALMFKVIVLPDYNVFDSVLTA